MNARASLFGKTVLASTIALAAAASCSSGGGGQTGAAGGTSAGTAGATSAGTAGSTGTGTAGSTGTGTAGSTGTGTAGSTGAGTAGSTGAGGTTGAAGATGAGGATGTGGTTGTAGATGAGGAFSIVPAATWPSSNCKTMAATLVGQMSRAEKSAQMVMAPLGNLSTTDVQTLAPGAIFAPGGYPDPAPALSIAGWGALLDPYIALVPQTAHQIPFLIGADTVHGNNTATGAVIFPHNAGLGGTNDPALVEQIGRITAQEAAAAGLNWAFAPVVSIAWDFRWGRVYESFNENPSIADQFAAAATMGLQGVGGLGTTMPGIVACSKHWAGDGQAGPPMPGVKTWKGGIVDRGNITLDLTALMQVGVAPYMGPISAGLGSIMVSDATWMGSSLTSSSQMITTVLKGQLGFAGFVSTDWNAATDSPGSTIPKAIMAGVDMLMQPSDWKGAINTINTSTTTITDARITDAATRIIQTKCQAGLFGWKRDTTLAATVGTDNHRTVARQAVRESMVLLQNTGNVLPLATSAKVWVGGSGADSLANQMGGWTITWQGNGALTTGTTIKAAIGKVATIVPNVTDADVAVVVLSEMPYAEFEGDRPTLDTLPTTDFTALATAKTAGKKVVAIVLSGRPVTISTHMTSADAWIAAWLPGSEGDGVADVLFGTYHPTAKLSHSWPAAATDYSIMATGYTPQFPAGFGLTY
jgi:beta-glucosidase